MPERAHIFATVKNPELFDRLSTLLSDGGHTLEIVALTRAAAFRAIDRLGNTGIDVALIAQSLTKFKVQGPIRSKRDLVIALRERAPEIKVLVIAPEEIVEADKTLNPAHLDQLSQAIDQL